MVKPQSNDGKTLFSIIPFDIRLTSTVTIVRILIVSEYFHIQANFGAPKFGYVYKLWRAKVSLRNI